MKNICKEVNGIKIQVNYNVELFGLLITLSDESILYPNLFQFDKNNDGYINDLKNTFNKYCNHLVVKEFNELKNKYKLHYQNPIELALLLDDNYEINKSSSEFFKKEDIINFCKKLNVFQKEIKFYDFFTRNCNLYLSWISNICESFKNLDIKKLLSDYCGKKYNNIEYCINLIPFETNGGYAFNIGNTSYYCLKAINCKYVKDNEIFIKKDNAYLIVTLHEFLHSIINPLTKDSNYFNNGTNYFKEYYTNSYNNDYYVVNENVVRAIVIRIISGLNMKYDIQNMIENEVNNGFGLVPIIYNKLEEYEGNRNKYINIDLFYDELLQNLIWR